MTITTNTASLRDRIDAITARYNWLEECSQILLFSVERGTVAIEQLESMTRDDLMALLWASDADVAAWKPGTPVPTGQLERPWREDQLRQSVPVVCPPWCTVDHGRLDPDGLRITPSQEQADHECILATGVLTVALNQSQPYSGPRLTTVAVYGIDGGQHTIELEPSRFADFAEEASALLAAARGKTAELTAVPSSFGPCAEG